MKALFSLLVAVAVLTGCEPQPLSQQRAERQAEARGDVVIAVAWPLKSSKATLAKGVELAVDEINANGGVLGGRKVRIVLKDDAASLSTGRQVAQEIANDTEVAAVIGHLNSYVTAPASRIYDDAGLVMVTPGASGQKITDNGGQFVFRSLPGNRDQGRQIGNYAAAQGYKHVAIYYIKNDYGIDLANHFEQRAHELGIAIADRRSYDMGGDDYSVTVNNWAAFLKMDAIFLVGSLPESPKILRDIRAAGIKVPVFGGAGLDSPDLIKNGGASVEGTVVFSLFNLDDPRPEVLAFGEKYRKKFGVLPDSTAAQGYDALNLLAQAMNKAQSTVPAKVATALRSTKDWRGVTGNHTFSEKGDLVAKNLAKLVVNDGKFVYFDTNPPLRIPN
jgi:branched-chain amino acid transport system substrate-binding protein